MDIQNQIEEFIASHSEPKQGEIKVLHTMILQTLPECRLWFETGKNGEGKVVSNPTIGYGIRTIQYADGKTKEFFKIGLSSNKTGISIYILGIDDKTFLARTYGKALGKASVTGYCIRFRKLSDINIEVLEAAIRDSR